MKIFNKLLLVIFSSLFCASCESNENINETRKYEDYAEFSFSDVNEMYNLEEEHYYIEFYSTTCPHCEKLKTSLFDYLDKYKEEKVTTKVYIFDAHSSESDFGKAIRSSFKTKQENYNREELLKEMEDAKPLKVSDTYWFAIPGLFEVTNGKYTSYTLGSESIASLYANLK